MPLPRSKPAPHRSPVLDDAMADPRSIRRVEDHRFVTGQGYYVDDEPVPNRVFAAFLRSPHAHARITALKVDAAHAMKGVLGVFTAQDVNKRDDHPDGLGPLPTSIQLGERSTLYVPPRFPLCAETVRFVGDLVAMVVADCPRRAQEALEQIQIDYEPLKPVIDPLTATDTDQPRIWPEAAHNQAFLYERGDDAATQQAFAKAAHCVELSLVNNRIAAAALEPRCAVATWDAQTASYHLSLSAASLHFIQKELADCVLAHPNEQLVLISPDVGGGFGMKNVTYPEYALLLWASKRLNRPIHWTAERMEDFLSGVHGRDNVTHARLALDRRGRFLALDIETRANIGAYVTSLGPGSATVAPTPAMGGLYAIPTLSMRVRGVFTTMAPIDAYRGAGKPEANYMLERLIDCAAAQINMDPIALRRRNFIKTFPYTNATGFTLDCGEFEHNLDRALQAIDAKGFAKRRAAAKKTGRLRGLGIGCFLETSRGPAEEEAWLQSTPDGLIEIVVGTQSNGQGHETSFPQLMASLLHVPASMFRYVQANTALIPTGGGHGGARSLHMAGTALVHAAQDFLQTARRSAAASLQLEADQLVYVQGVFTQNAQAPLVGPHISLQDLLRLIPATPSLQRLEGHGIFKQAPLTFPNGCHAAEIELDPDTGAVTLIAYIAIDDYGRLINPMLTESQVQGGLMQGIGQALMEAIHYDPDSGQLITSSLMDYAVPRADQAPPMKISLVECPTRSNPLGVKGAGQAGAIGAPQTVMNAIIDALKPYGIRHIDMPATPARIFAAIQTARTQHPA